MGRKSLRSISGDIAKASVYETTRFDSQGLDKLAGGLPRRPERSRRSLHRNPGGTRRFAPKRSTRSGRAGHTRDARLSLLDLPLDNGTFRQLNLSMGAAHVVYGSRANLLDNAVNCTEFFRNESCGKCVPCRMGSQKLVEIGTALLRGKRTVNLETIEELGDTMEFASICGLGQVAPNPLRMLIKFFPQEVSAPAPAPPVDEPTPPPASRKDDESWGDMDLMRTMKATGGGGRGMRDISITDPANPTAEAETGARPMVPWNSIRSPTICTSTRSKARSRRGPATKAKLMDFVNFTIDGQEIRVPAW